MQKLFTDIGVSAVLAAGLGKAGISQPTDIQAEVIPLILQGGDVIGQSATGTGKTLAYLLPLFQKLDLAAKETQAVILTPTHELAMQIYHQIEMLAQNAGINVTAVPIIGKVNMARQIEALKSRPGIIVGSGGRILELIQKRKINAQTVRTIIVDEADRLLDDANWENIRAVVKTTLRDRQMLLFSATVPPLALARAKELMRNPEVVFAQGQSGVPEDISHMYFVAEQRDKIEVLRKLVNHLNVERALVFINQGDTVETTVLKLNYHGLAAAGIHGSAVKTDRQRALEDFRNRKVRVLVASDLAARGLDIPGVEYVFNLELADDPELYLHRVGRTGRAGQSGTAISLVTRKEMTLIAKLEKVLKITLAPKQIIKGRIIDITPKAGPVKRQADKIRAEYAAGENRKKQRPQ